MGEPEAYDRSRQWVLRTVIGVAATLLLSAISVVIVLLFNQNPPPAPGPAPTTGYTAAPSTYFEGQTPASQQQAPAPVPPAPPPPPPAVRPPLIEGPDNSASHQSCDYGYSLNNIAGWGSHAGRGTPDTSFCPGCPAVWRVLTESPRPDRREAWARGTTSGQRPE